MQKEGRFWNDPNVEGNGQTFDNLEIEFDPDDVKFVKQGGRGKGWQTADESKEVTDPEDSSKKVKVRKFSGGSVPQGSSSYLTYEGDKIHVKRWWFTLGDAHGVIRKDDPFNPEKGKEEEGIKRKPGRGRIDEALRELIRDAVREVLRDERDSSPENEGA